jgi:hypothetical protein
MFESKKYKELCEKIFLVREQFFDFFDTKQHFPFMKKQNCLSGYFLLSDQLESIKKINGTNKILHISCSHAAKKSFVIENPREYKIDLTETEKHNFISSNYNNISCFTEQYDYYSIINAAYKNQELYSVHKYTKNIVSGEKITLFAQTFVHSGYLIYEYTDITKKCVGHAICFKLNCPPKMDIARAPAITYYLNKFNDVVLSIIGDDIVVYGK